MQRLLITFVMLCSIISISLAQEQETVLTDIIGQTLPEAEATLNAAGFRLAPVILSIVTDGTNTGTVIDAINLEEDNMVQVTVAREYNVTLVWDNAADFVNGLSGNELFTFINRSDEVLSLRNLEIADFDISAWQASLRAGQCAQIWSYDEAQPFQLEGCASIQGGNVARLLNEDDQFWIADDTFDIVQNGIHRATCIVEDGACDLWLSPGNIPTDITTYIYLIYDDSQLVIYNNDTTRWMDLSQLEIDGIGNLATTRIWDTISHPDLDRLAPGQCVRFTRNQNSTPLTDCTVIATYNTAQNEIFWTQSFALNDALTGTNTLNCPPSSGSQTLCLLNR